MKISINLKDSSTRSYLGGTAWLTAGTVTYHFGSIFSLMWIARLLGANEYGKLILLQTGISTLSSVLSIGFGTIATKTAARYSSEVASEVNGELHFLGKITFCVTTIISIALFSFSDIVAEYVVNDPHLASFVKLIAVSVVFLGLDFFFKSIMIGFGAVREFAVATIASAAVGFPIWILLAWKFQIAGALAGFVFCQFIQMTLSAILMHRSLRTKASSLCTKSNVSKVELLTAVGLIFFTNVLATPSHWVCQVLLVRSGASYVELAMLGISLQWFTALLYLPGVASRMLLPVLTRHMSDGTSDTLHTTQLLRLSVITNLAAVAPFALILALSKDLILTFYSMPSGTASKAFALFCFTSIIAAATLPVGQLLIAQGKILVASAMNSAWAVVYVGIAIFSSRFGAAGIACALAAAYVLHGIWVVRYVTVKDALIS